MPVLQPSATVEREQLECQRIAACLHVTTETANLMHLESGGEENACA